MRKPRTAVAISAASLLASIGIVTALGGSAGAAAGTIYGCLTTSRTIVNVRSVPVTCTGQQVQISWQGTIGPNPTPSTTTPAPTPSVTTPAPTPSVSTSTPPPGPVTAGNVSCNYGDDTWSGDASSVGYQVHNLSHANGNLASWSDTINANPGTTEVVGYPSDQCLMYEVIPSTWTSSFSQTPPSGGSNLDYEFAYDIWLASTAQVTMTNPTWNPDLELMIWTYVHGQVPAGSPVATLADGSIVWTAGGNEIGTVTVVLPQNETSGTVNIGSIITQLKAQNLISNTDRTGALDTEYGVEAPYGGGQTFTVNGFSVTTG